MANNDDAPKRGRKQRARFENLAVLFAVGYIFFIFGAFITQFRISPFYGWLVPSFRALVALRESHSPEAAGSVSSPWQIVRHGKRGVTKHDKSQCYEGYTFLSLGSGTRAVLIDMSGSIVHSWNLPFPSVWPNPDHMLSAPDVSRIAWPRAYLYPNGDILAVYAGGRVSPWGCGLAKMNKDSKLIWRYSQQVHHEVSVDESGMIYTLAHGVRHKSPSWIQGVYAPYIDDDVVILNPDGKEVERINILSAFRDTEYQSLLQQSIFPDAKGDLLHANCVKPLTPAFAEKNSFAKAGQLLVSMRTVSLLAIIDRDSKKVVWATAGPWGWQHDPDPLDNGNILVFDNLSLLPDRHMSRIVEYDPRSKQSVWVHGGTSGQYFYSHFWGTEQKLPNGNVLFAVSAAGRVVEVTQDHDVVWEWFNPERKGELDEYIEIVYSAVRFASDDLPFLKQKE